MKYTFFVLFIIGIITLVSAGYTDTVEDNSKCKLRMHDSVELPLDPAVCGFDTWTISDLKKGECVNNFNNCYGTHTVFENKFKNRMCVPTSASNTAIVGSVEISGGNCGSGTTETVYYRYENITGCKCATVEYDMTI